MRRDIRHISLLILTVLLVAGCAKMGQPDGGWYDEEPPYVIGSTPGDKATGVTTNKVNIFFNEFIKLENANEKVVISPPQLEMPEIVAGGRRIKVELKDSLKPNTTYTIDFSDAISDNNEGNPMGNYTYTFSTGDTIDTLEVSGHVIDASNLEPVKGILVGLYDSEEFTDSTFHTVSLLRVSRTDSYGRFVVRGIAPGTYRVFALQDADGDYRFTQKSEMIAFSDAVIEPTCKPDIRLDTLWRDSLHIHSILQVPYAHYLPDNIVLTAFTEVQTNRYLLKSERKEADHFTLFFSYGSDTLPRLRGLNFDEKDAFIVEATENRDTLTYWLRDTMLVNQDTLRLEMTYMATDTTGVLAQQTDTLEVLSKQPYDKRIKQKQRALEEWTKQQEKAKKRGKEFLEVMPPEELKPKWNITSTINPDQNPSVEMPTPLAIIDTAKVHLYFKQDTLWNAAPYEIKQHYASPRTYQLLGEWEPGSEYKIETDSAAFIDIYGKASNTMKQNFKVGALDAYSTLIVNLGNMSDTTIVVELLDKSDKVAKRSLTKNGVAEFFFVSPATYYMRMFIDSNDNGKWDTGNYDDHRQAETVYYYSSPIECKAKWDINLSWNPTSKNIATQKPREIVKQKPEKEKTIKSRNAERARAMGKEYVNNLIRQ